MAIIIATFKRRYKPCLIVHSALTYNQPMQKSILTFLSFLFLMTILWPAKINAQTMQTSPETAFEARVVEVLEQRQSQDLQSNYAVQQKLKLIALSGDMKNREFEFNGLTEVEVFGAREYKKGDRVLAQHSIDPDGQDVYYVVDFVRRPYIYLLAIIFVLITIIIAKLKGFRALISLITSFFIIMQVMVPLILLGWPPLPVGIAGSIVIFIFMVYLTEGFNKESHISILAIAISLTIVGILSVITTYTARFTGTEQEETMFLLGITKQALNFKGLLLTGILIGTLGVLDDIIIGQVQAVVQIKKANPFLNTRKVFSMAMEIGNSHMGSMVNTLFLAYAGASLPLILLFSIKQPPFMTFSQVINNEMIATEIARTLLGSIGIALAMPIATYLAAKYYGVPLPTKKQKSNLSSPDGDILPANLSGTQGIE